MPVRQRKCFVLVLAVVFLFLSLKSYIVSNAGHRIGTFGLDSGVKDVFENDHIDIPEIPVGKKALNDSDYEDLYRKGMTVRRVKPADGRNGTRLRWHTDIKAREIHVEQYQNEIEVSNDEQRANRELSKQELGRYLEHFKHWPEGKPKAAFYVLANRLSRLKVMLESVDRYFNDQFQYPMIIFHEANMVVHIPAIRKMTRSLLFFQLVSFQIPSFLTSPVSEHIACFSKISYRHMCRFNAKLVYEEPTIQVLDYYWRLDDDSELLTPVTYDVFEFMRDKELQYGYSWMHYDAISCVTGLWEATARYIKEHDITPTFFHEWRRPRLYYNNFEIASTKMWLSEEYRAYMEYLDRLGGIYYVRWGDAPIHGIAVALFLQKSEVHEFSDIGYKHTSYVHYPTNGTVAPRMENNQHVRSLSNQRHRVHI